MHTMSVRTLFWGLLLVAAGCGAAPTAPRGLSSELHSSLRKSLELRAAELEACDAGASGPTWMQASLSFAASGEVTSVDVQAGTPGDEGVAQCYATVLSALRLRAGSEPSSISVSLPVVRCPNGARKVDWNLEDGAPRVDAWCEDASGRSGEYAVAGWFGSYRDGKRDGEWLALFEACVVRYDLGQVTSVRCDGAADGEKLSKKEVQVAMLSVFPSVRTCSVGADRTGRLDMEFLIDTSGQLTDVHIDSPEFEGAAVADCVAEVLRSTRLRPHEKVVLIKYPFRID